MYPGIIKSRNEYLGNIKKSIKQIWQTLIGTILINGCKAIIEAIDGEYPCFDMQVTGNPILR